MPAAGDAGAHGRGAAAWVVRRRRWVLAAWAVAFVLLAPAAARVERVLDVSAHVDGSESAAVDATLRTRFATPFAHYAVLVATGLPRPATPAGRAALGEVVAAVRGVAGVTGTLSHLDAGDPMFDPPRGGGTFVLVGFDGTRGGPLDAMIPRLRAATERAAARMRPAHPHVALRWTGDVALNHDLRRTSAAEAQRAELRALPLTLALLVVAFGAVVAALLPAAAAVLAITVALGLAAVVGARWPLSILLQNVVTMLGLGLGVDYALLMLARFREELAAGHDRVAAAVRAAGGAGHTVLLSAAAVLIGFAGLLLIPLNELRAVAVGGALVVVAAALAAVTLLPALLAMLGARVDLGRVSLGRMPLGRVGRRRPAPAPAGTGPTGERWRRWGSWVTRHPGLVLAAAGAPLLLLAAEARRLETTLPRANWLPPRMESARALDDLTGMDRAGVAQALRVVVELPPGTSVLEADGWQAVARVSRALAADPRVGRVQSLPIVVPLAQPSFLATSLIPTPVRRTFVSTDQRAGVVEVLPASGASFPALTRLVRDLRARDAAALTGVPGARLLVGGMPAFNADYEDAVAGRLGTVVALVVGGTLAALCVGFRSVLVPLKAVALNLVSVAAALGAVVLVFQDGRGGALVGVDAPLGGLFPALPALVFCLVFGLSMDYEVFLVARVAEARRAGLGERAAVAEGLAHTGGVITSAAAIMVVVFAAFVLGDFLMIKVLGFALATAVLLDATVVRLAVSPALLALAGRWNWWPGRLPAHPRAQSVHPAPVRPVGTPRAATPSRPARPRASGPPAPRATRHPPCRRCWTDACSPCAARCRAR